MSIFDKEMGIAIKVMPIFIIINRLGYKRQQEY